MRNSGYSLSNRYDEKAISILTNYFLSEHGTMFDIQFHGSKDNTPDTDGFIRLREENKSKKETGRYLNKTVFFQLKGCGEKIDPKNYHCQRKVFDFCSTTNLPTILFIVDNLAESKTKYRIHWYIFNNINVDLIKNLDTGAKKVLIPNLEELYSNGRDLYKTFYEVIKDLTHKDLFQDLPKNIRDLSITYRNSIIKIVTSLYLLQNITISDLSKLAKILKINWSDFQFFIRTLEKENLIFKSDQIVVFQDKKDQFNRYIGRHLSYEGSQNIDINNLLRSFPSYKTNIFDNMTNIHHPNIVKKLEKEALAMKNKIKNLNNPQDILTELSVYEHYAYSLPKKSAKIMVDYIEDIIKGDFNEEIILKSLDILKQKRIFFFSQKEVLRCLFKLLRVVEGESEIFNKVENIIKENIKYDIHVIEAWEYVPQLKFLSYIEEWGPYKKKWYCSILIKLLEALLSSECEGTEWQDENTISLQRGGIPVTEKLRDIRERSMSYLIRMFRENQNIEIQQKILKALNNATQMPISYTTPVSEYKELKQLIIKNTEEIIEFYTEILDECELALVRIIDEQTVSFERKYGKKLKGLEKLKTKIANKDNYNILKVFTEVYLLDKDGNYLDWREQEKFYLKEIKKFVEELNSKNAEKWIEKIKIILEQISKDRDLFSARYLKIFLEELGKEKPDLGFKFLEELEDVLDNYMYDLLVGLWKGEGKQKIREKILEWIKESKHLRQILLMLETLKFLDYEILEKIYQSKNKEDEVNIFTLILIVILKSYTSEIEDKEKYIELAIKNIENLTEREDAHWRDYYFNDQEIFNNLDKDQYEKIIDNLVFAKSLDYHTENILIPIIAKYPDLIVKLFKMRIIREKADRDKQDRQYYDAIPLDFDHIKENLKQQKKVLIPGILELLGHKEVSFLQVVYLLKAIFPLEDIVPFISDGEEFTVNRQIIVYLTHGYQGHIKLDGDFVQIYLNTYEDEKEHTDLMSLMSVPGRVVTGEFGFADDLEKRLEEADIILHKTKNSKLRKFIEKYKELLRRREDYERKTTNEDIAIRKSKFNQ